MEVVLIKSFSEKPWRSPDTYELIEKSLSQKWSVKSISTKDSDELHQLLTYLGKNSQNEIFVFNIAEYLDETQKMGFIPALLDEWSIPHLGSSAEIISLGLDKAKTKIKLIEKGIPTPRFFIAKNFGEDYSRHANEIKYPLFVKPLNEGGHIGIGDHSIVYNDLQLKTQIENIIQQYDQPAMVEEFIGGKYMREFSVGIICGEPILFTPIEIDFDAMAIDTKILSFESAEEDLERIKKIEDHDTITTLKKITLNTFNAVGAYDYSRVDVRMNDTGFYVLEINVMPGLGPHSFLPEAADSLHGIHYEQLIQRLVYYSSKRQGLGY